MKARRAPYITPFLFLVICISWVTESLIYRPDNRLISFSSKRIEYIFRNAFCKNRFSIFLGEFEQFFAFCCFAWVFAYYESMAQFILPMKSIRNILKWLRSNWGVLQILCKNLITSSIIDAVIKWEVSYANSFKSRYFAGSTLCFMMHYKIV